MSYTVQTNSEKFDKATLNICLARSILSVIHTHFGDNVPKPYEDAANSIYAVKKILDESYDLLI